MLRIRSPFGRKLVGDLGELFSGRRRNITIQRAVRTVFDARLGQRNGFSLRADDLARLKAVLHKFSFAFRYQLVRMIYIVSTVALLYIHEQLGLGTHPAISNKSTERAFLEILLMLFLCCLVCASIAVPLV